MRALRRPHLVVLWSSQVFSAVGDQLYSVAVIWLGIQVAGTAGGLVAAAQDVAALVFGVLGGVYADRWNRQRAMVGADFLRTLAVLTLPALAAAGALHLWSIVTVSLAVGGLGALFDPALQASLPSLSGDIPTLQALNALMDTTRRIARALGPAAAGLLALVIPVVHFFTADALTFAVSAAAVLSLGRRYAWKAGDADAPAPRGAHVFRDVVDAIRLVRRHALVHFMLLGSGVINFAWSLAFTLGAALLASRSFHAGIGAYGSIVGAYGAGNIVSSLIVGSLPVRRPAVLIFGGKLVLGLGFLAMAVAPTLPLAVAGACLAAFGGPMGDIPLATAVQTEFPPAQIGKVYSLLAAAQNLGSVVGFLTGAPLFALLGTRQAIAVGALAVLLMGVSGLAKFGAAPVRTDDAPCTGSGEEG